MFRVANSPAFMLRIPVLTIPVLAPLALSLLVLTLFTVGCSNPTQKDLEKVKNGMSIDNVHDVLGEPHGISEGQVGDLIGTSEQWFTPDYTITVQYLNGEVKLKTIQPRSGVITQSTEK